jgi:dihydrofolate reductase
VGGPHLAAQAFKAGLVDECHLIHLAAALGGGKPVLPTDTRAELALLDERRFSKRRPTPPLPGPNKRCVTPAWT